MLLAQAAKLGSGLNWVDIVGLPEAAFALHQAALYLTAAPKSDSVKRTMGAARDAVEATPGATVPPHLRSGGYSGAARLGHGTEYRYPHDHPDAIVPQCSSSPITPAGTQVAAASAW